MVPIVADAEITSTRTEIVREFSQSRHGIAAPAGITGDIDHIRVDILGKRGLDFFNCVIDVKYLHTAAVTDAVAAFAADVRSGAFPTLKESFASTGEVSAPPVSGAQRRS